MARLRGALDNPQEKEYGFGNARGVRSFFQSMRIAIAERVFNDKQDTPNVDIQCFTIEDIKEAEQLAMIRVK